MIAKIEKLKINLFPESSSKEVYAKERAEFIADYTEHSTGFLGYLSGGDDYRPEIGEAKWNKFYPNGYEDWAGRQRELTAFGEQNVIDKINEIIDVLNKLKRGR